MLTSICITNTSCINNYKTSTQNLTIVQTKYINNHAIYKILEKNTPNKAKESEGENQISTD
jgi:hypothetical protein